MSANLANNVALDNGNVLNLASVSKRDRYNLIAHTRLTLRVKEITPSFRQCLHGAKWPNAKVSDGSQPPMTFDLPLSETAGSRSLDRLVRCRGLFVQGLP